MTPAIWMPLPIIKKTKDQSKKLHHVEDLAMDIIIL